MTAPRPARVRYIRRRRPADHAPWTGHSHTLIVGRRSITWQRYPAGWPPKRNAGGSRTPGPWTSWYLPGLGYLTVARDQTLFGWDS